MRSFLLVLLLGCGTSGSKGDGGLEGGAGAADGGRTFPLSSLDDVCDGNASLTGRAVLAKVSMPTKATLAYYMKGDAAAPMPTLYTLDVAYAGGTIICTTHGPPLGNEGPPVIASIQIAVVVGFKTEDGAFAETGFDGTLSSSGTSPSLSASESLSSIKGTYTPTTMTGTLRVQAFYGSRFGLLAEVASSVTGIGSFQIP